MRRFPGIAGPKLSAMREAKQDCAHACHARPRRIQPGKHDALGLSLADLAAHLGLPEETVSDWERDHAEPRTNALFRLAGVLSVAPSWLIAGIGESPEDTHEARDLHPLVQQLREVRKLHEQTGHAIAALEAEISAILGKSGD